MVLTICDCRYATGVVTGVERANSRCRRSTYHACPQPLPEWVRPAGRGDGPIMALAPPKLGRAVARMAGESFTSVSSSAARAVVQKIFVPLAGVDVESSRARGGWQSVAWTLPAVTATARVHRCSEHQCRRASRALAAPWTVITGATATLVPEK